MPLYSNVFSTISISLLLLSFPLSLFGGEQQSRISFTDESPSYLTLVAKHSDATFVRNIRAHQHKNYTRLVLDLDGAIHPEPSDRRTGTMFTLELPNTRILKKALLKTIHDTFPIETTITRTKKGTLVLSIPTKSWKRYKWYILPNTDTYRLRSLSGSFLKEHNSQSSQSLQKNLRQNRRPQ